MNVTGVNSATAQYQSSIQSSFKKQSQDFKALQTALQSGDLTSAQQAFASLQKDQPNSTQAASTTSNASGQNSPLGNDFQALQTALQSGNISSAQSAFATLKQDMQGTGAAHGARHHHHHGGGASTTGTSQPASSTSSTTDPTSILSSLLDTQA